jgi:hypothetical protein
MPVILKGQFPRSSGWAEFTIENKWLTEKPISYTVIKPLPLASKNKRLTINKSLRHKLKGSLQ